MLKAFVFKPLSPFKSFPTTNTIFGAICWGIRWLESGEKLLETLEMFKTGRPPFIISAPLPWKRGKWVFPRPIHFIPMTPKNVEKYREIQRVQKSSMGKLGGVQEDFGERTQRKLSGRKTTYK
jgi:CRISPR/Cas system CSM-associated protein Csm4 (group 5 of RAMP superfamily)